MKTLNKLLTVLMVVALSLSCVFMLACKPTQQQNNPTVTPAEAIYDIGVGGDYSVQVDLKGNTFKRLKQGTAIVDTSEYIFNAESGELKIYEIYIRYLEYGEYTFSIETAEGATASFKVEVKNAIETSFGEVTSKNYVFGSKEDIAFDVNFSTATITALTRNGKAIDNEVWAYENDQITLDGEWLDTLYGNNKFTVTLSNFDSYDFYVVSDCLFQANVDNYEDIIYEGWWNVLAPSIYEEGWDGKAIRYTGNGGNMCMFGNTPDQGLGVAYEEGQMYRLTFQFKNNWSAEGNPTGTIGFNPGYNNPATSNTTFVLNYLNNTVRGGSYEYDEETGVYSVTIDYMACLENTWTLMFFGYDGSDPTRVMFDVLLDNILLVKAPQIDVSMPEAEQTINWQPGTTTNIWVSANVGNDPIVKLSVKGGEEVATNCYNNYASTIMISADYLNTIRQDTTFVLTLKSGAELEFVLDIALAKPTTFDSYNERVYAAESNTNMAFAASFGEFKVKEVVCNDTVINAANWKQDANSFTLRANYLESLEVGEYNFKVVMNNDGFVEGVTGDEVHTFKVTVTDIDTAKGYIAGSMENVSFRMAATEIKGVAVGGVALTEEEYVFKAGVLTLYGEYCETLLGNTEVVVTLADESTQTLLLMNSLVYANNFESDAWLSAPKGEKVFAYMGTAQVDGIDGKSAQLTNATGGHFIVFTKPGNGCPWNASGEYYGVNFQEHVEYELAFDVKNIGTAEEGTAPSSKLEFYVHGYNSNGSERLGRFVFDEEGAVVAKTNNLKVIALEDGAYRIVFNTYYTTQSSAFNSWDTICVEAGGWQSFYYTLQFDNVSLTQEVVAFEYYNTEANYVVGSNKDATYRMLEEGVAAVAVNGETLTADQYAFENGVLAIKAAYCENLIGDNQVVVTLADESTKTLVLKSSVLYAEDFEDGAWMSAPKGEKIFAYMGTSQVDGIDGKSAQITKATGGHFLVITKPGYGCPWSGSGEYYGLALEEEVEYTFAFEVKYAGTAEDNTAPNSKLEFYVHGYNEDGSERLGRFMFDESGAVVAKTNNLEVIALEDGAYRIVFKTYYTTESKAFNGWDTICVEAGGYNSFWYTIQFDNVIFSR